MSLILLISLIFINSSLATPCNELEINKVYTVEQAFECIESVKVNRTVTEAIKKDITAIFETYVYKDILLSPPAIKGKVDYYQKVDIDKLLKELDTTETSMYSFYQKIENIFFATHDLHLTFRISSNEEFKYYFDSFYAVLPFSIDIINEGKDVILIPYDILTHYGVNLPQEIIDNSQVPVQSINKMKPLDWIRKYAEEHTFLKSSHGRFTYAIESMSNQKLTSSPFEKSFLSESIDIVYSNGQTVSTGYSMLYKPLISLNKKQQEKIKAKEEGKNMKPISLNDFIDLKQDSNNFDYESLDKNIACKTFKEDGKQTINIFVLKTFYPETEVDNFFETFDKCIAQFDENDDPVAMILPMNGGGYGDLESNIENLLAPYEDTALIGSVRISPGAENCIKHEYGSGMYDPINCTARYNITGNLSIPLGEFYTKPVPVVYGNNVTHIKSQVSLLVPETMLASRFTKHPRNPNQIILFTDGFCYSACALLTKGMWERGSAIIVGYEGDPEGDIEWFDAGQSPTAVIGMDEMFLPEGDDLARYGGFMRTSFYEYFEWNLDYNKESNPREFTLSPIDERVQIYKYTEDKLEEFVKEARKIFEKYENGCNPKNKMLTKYSSECDNQITVEHGHGGFICGDDGKWSNKCKVAYCDHGYKWDEYNQRCIDDACYKTTDDDNTNKKEWIIIIVFIIAVIVIGIIIIGIIFVGVYLSKRKEKGYTPITN
ncbi:hypothetical protein EDI_133080 [Entamoeba dispar SAW760]|uniref:Uncharacterized protein n=1 Tax=Entamoeba dispar (strain ATCC PRA-260 / SAW760) TaxID=370354 RepID=B0EJE6_ENTDS|nr:uncharacterized protein EDI_133080 [Entamoeba dispar SAW760]EDR25341.1 hypothetical protein EDI_133080 [Entamoeba dispar SAW760]|eukprot:EDR25341.1 hypothetical protein EDI_133080 [Entamoeba dispar SAW760]